MPQSVQLCFNLNTMYNLSLEMDRENGAIFEILPWVGLLIFFVVFRFALPDPSVFRYLPDNGAYMIAYCGIDCSKCDSYLATRAGNDDAFIKVAKKLSIRYHADVKPDYVICDGCKDGERHSFYCRNSCKMRKCCITKEYNSCIECADFPCKELQFELEHNPEAIVNLKNLKR